MRLFQAKNQRRFSAFQFELGGTWAERDPRHGQDWSQWQTAQYLTDCGYHLFMIGRHDWLRVVPEFFLHASISKDEGFGAFVHGNLVCLHSRFGLTSLKNMVHASANLAVD